MIREYDENNLEEIVAYINDELRKGRTMKDIENNDFGENERVIAKRLGRKGYKKINGIFVLPDSYKEPEQPVSKPKSQIKKDIDNESIQEDNITPVENNSIPVPAVIDIANLNLNENKNFADLNEKVEYLELLVEELENKFNENKNTQEPIINTEEDSSELSIYYNEDKPAAKTVRLYKEIWDKIDKVKAQYPHLSYQTVLNSLINEITDKYLQ